MAKPFGVSGTVCPHFGGISICTALPPVESRWYCFPRGHFEGENPHLEVSGEAIHPAEIEVLQCTALILHIRLKS